MTVSFLISGLTEPMRTFRPAMLKMRCSCRVAQVKLLRVWFSGMISRLRLGQIFSIAAMAA